MSTNASRLAREEYAETEAERITAHGDDADLAQLGQPPRWLWDATHTMGDPQRGTWVLLHYLGECAKRAGVLDALRACLVADAQRRNDRDTLRVLGAPMRPDPAAPGVLRPERAARNLVERMAAVEAHRLTPSLVL